MPLSNVGPTRIRALQAAIAPAYALLAGIELDLFSALGDEAIAGQEIARRGAFGVHQDGDVVAGVDAYVHYARLRTSRTLPLCC